MNRFAGLYSTFLREPSSRPLMYHWNGIPIHVIQDQPKMQVSESFRNLQSPELVAETNAWMKSFFGMTNWLEDGKVIKAADPAFPERGVICFAMNPRTYKQLQSKTAAIVFPTL